MTNYSRGRQFEWSVRDEFIAAGWVVVRSAGSKTPMDLIAVKKALQPGHSLIAFVQCKGGARPISSAEWNALVEMAKKCGAMPVLVDRPSPRTRRYWCITGPRSRGSRAHPCVEFRP